MAAKSTRPKSYVWILAALLLAVTILARRSNLPIQVAPETPLPARPEATATVLPAPPTPAATQTVTATALLPTATPTLPPTATTAPRLLEAWKTWSVLPEVSSTAVEIYRRGLASGNDPRTFSVLGDCQSLPETFLGVYDTDPGLVADLPAELQETIHNFSGAFSRPSPTIKAGTTAAALLWFAWHENQYGCQPNETPLDCELRLVRPSIAFINIGTHYETRNINYLRKVIDTLIARGTLPILATKADNRELDDRLNLEMAQLALEYEIPLWNFYAAVSDLPDHGVSLKAGEEHLGVIYLVPEALERHRFTALQALDAVWRRVRE